MVELLFKAGMFGFAMISVGIIAFVFAMIFGGLR